MTMPPPPQQPPGFQPGPGPYQGPPPGPYQQGQAPAYPGPYGQQAGPYGQQAGAGPYGPPPQPGFPQQYPGPYAGPMYGGPMGPQPPRKKRTGLVIGIVAGSLVLLSCLGYGVKMVMEGAGTSFPAAEYKLTVPKTLVDGEYTLAQDMSGTEGEKLLTETHSADVRTDGAAVAQYTAESDGELKALVVSGLYGQIKHPDAERRGVLRGAGTAENARIEIPAKDVTPPGSEVTVECEVLTNTEAGNEVTFPMCAWGDANTAVGVGLVDAASVGQQPEDIDLAAAAELTLKVRAEIRKPLTAG
ncbi:hypothetical protein QWM81_10805 [Streptomyces ficellus]|uniref:DUF5666 domain-containing protein n=1 Tax=Streptomyces ficellus TaxID=1977088 RepID=A0ABT7Z4Y0_9ACTN|nr:hypothetical protein [Streptomyces ficellus]MDN3294532.1 hypothetical protein [Streptomyces ficellus]